MFQQLLSALFSDQEDLEKSISEKISMFKNEKVVGFGVFMSFLAVFLFSLLIDSEVVDSLLHFI